MSTAETIFALASATGKAGIAVIRVSGDHASNVFSTMLKLQQPPNIRKLQQANFYDSQTQEILDYGLYAYFKAPHSYTGEDCIELHCHGSQATITALLLSLSKIPNFRLAEPGEFSRRGFLNGKFDLTQAESIIDLIDAETDHQRRAALAHSQGELYRLYAAWWQELLKLRAYTEACLDFVDEDLPDDTENNIIITIKCLKQAIDKHYQTAQRGERLMRGTNITIIGPSNAGKSSLLNHFTRHPTAIISPIAGTTRDCLTHSVDFYGHAVNITDTAGFQQSEDIIEQEGIKRAKDKAQEADLVLIMVDAMAIPEELEQIMKPIKNQQKICIINKIELLTSSNINIPTIWQDETVCLLSLSANKGIESLHNTLKCKLQMLAGYDNSPIVTHVRYKQALAQTLAALERVETLLTHDIDWVMLAEELRQAQNSLGTIIGKADVEDLLEVIFAKFCIGK